MVVYVSPGNLVEIFAQFCSITVQSPSIYQYANILTIPRGTGRDQESAYNINSLRIRFCITHNFFGVSKSDMFYFFFISSKTINKDNTGWTKRKLNVYFSQIFQIFLTLPLNPPMIMMTLFHCHGHCDSFSPPQSVLL